MKCVRFVGFCLKEIRLRVVKNLNVNMKGFWFGIFRWLMFLVVYYIIVGKYGDGNYFSR